MDTLQVDFLAGLSRKDQQNNERRGAIRQKRAKIVQERELTLLRQAERRAAARLRPTTSKQETR